MDILLRTQTTDPSFTLRGCRALDQTDFESFLVVRSGPFQAQIAFWFDRYSLEQVIAGLKKIDRSLSGECKLGYRYEEPYIQFKGDGQGHILVSGLLTKTGPCVQRYEFALQTDQTCLHPFITDLEALINEKTL